MLWFINVYIYPPGWFHLSDDQKCSTESFTDHLYTWSFSSVLNALCFFFLHSDEPEVSTWTQWKWKDETIPPEMAMATMNGHTFNLNVSQLCRLEQSFYSPVYVSQLSQLNLHLQINRMHECFFCGSAVPSFFFLNHVNIQGFKMVKRKMTDISEQFTHVLVTAFFFWRRRRHLS